MKKYIFLRNKHFRPSSYYRVYQYIKDFKDENIIISEYESNMYYKLNKYKNKSSIILNKFLFMFIIGYFRRLKDLILLNLRGTNHCILVQRAIFPKYIGPFGKYLLKRSMKQTINIYWEFDDNIIYGKEITDFERELLVEKSSIITVGNEFLKNLILEKYRHKVQVINTTDKDFQNFYLEKAIKIRKDKFNNVFNMVWLGTDTNLKYLYNIINVLEEVSYEVNKKVLLKVICNKKLEIETKNLIVKNIKWSREGAIEQLYDCHIGLMPLKENDFTRGKCSFKAIQYMGAGIPIAISPVGMNKEIIENNKNGIFIEDLKILKDDLKNIIEDIMVWESMSIYSRKLWEEKFNPSSVEQDIKNKLNR